ncbi:MAG: saccharopine dehydrogenase NADP-binding domain-containing protein [Geitlerinemataceae cyanobacterium]
MSDRILVLGGSGRIGNCVAADIAAHTGAEITLTSRDRNFQPPDDRYLVQYCDINQTDRLPELIANYNLVIHCAGPFLHRDARVLGTCIECGVNYLDVSDSPEFTQKALAYHPFAIEAGVTAIINSGIFPGISNSMVRQGVEQLDGEIDRIHLSYVVSGSGGAGITVLRTTFLGLQKPLNAWIEGQWRSIQPYSDREMVEFPAPYNRVGVYWFDVPETLTLAESFPVQTVVTKFGSVPDFYNYLTWAIARFAPSRWLENPQLVEFLSRVSYGMTQFTDKFTGIGVAICARAEGKKEGKLAQYSSRLVLENTAIAAGAGTGSIAELMLSGQLNQPGVSPVERVLPTSLFEWAMQSRGINIESEWLRVED